MKKIVVILFLFITCTLSVQAQQYEVFNNTIINKEAVMAVEKDDSSPWITILLSPGRIRSAGATAGWGGSVSGMGTIVSIKYQNKTLRDEAFKKIFIWLNSK